MKYKNADAGKRIGIVVIDYIVIIVICILVASLSAYFIQDRFTSVSTYSPSNPTTPYSTLPDFSGFIAVIFLSIFAIFFAGIVYFAIIPSLWSKQTLGRAIFKCKVVKENDDEANFGSHFLRFFIGGIAYNVLNNFFFLGFILQIVFICKDPVTTLHDKIATTKMIDLNEKLNNNRDPFNSYSDPYKEKGKEKESDDDIFDFLN